jgi:hypothetical protein
MLLKCCYNLQKQGKFLKIWAPRGIHEEIGKKSPIIAKTKLKLLKRLLLVG